MRENLAYVAGVKRGRGRGRGNFDAGEGELKISLTSRLGVN